MAAVEGYTMQPDFLQAQGKGLTPALLGAEDTTPSSTSDDSTDVDLPRAASYTYFPSLKDTFFDAPETPSFSIEDLLPKTTITDSGSFTSSNGTSPDADPSPPLEIAPTPPKTSKSDVLRNSLPQLATSNATANKNKDSKTPVEKSHQAGKDDPPTPSNSLSSRLRRRSWMPGSRSPSPRKSAAPESPVDGTTAPAKGARASRRSSIRQSMTSESADATSPARSRSTSLSRRLSNKLRGRTLSTITDDGTAPDATPVPSIDLNVAHLPVSFSSDKLAVSAVHRSIPASERRPIHPRAHSQERPRMLKEPQRKRDELWTTFRTLDAEFQKFNAKSSSLKGNVIRQVLKPFLEDYKTHPSIDRLRPEDLERRATILNKWWTGLLELLHGKNNQSISATDRPAIFDGIIGLMERPEWRLSPSPFCPLSERNVHADNHSASSGSLSSQSSDFVKESVYHNIRSIFSFNILTQMTFVVDRMDKRPTPASLVQFCGQTCAYAFFFCPGIADVLVRLWNPTMGLLNRVLVECELPRAADLTETSKAIGSGFPPHLRSLQYTTLATTYRSLRKPAPLPPTTHDLPWSGVWVNRWTGKDSDLFYIFTKHYHLLVTDFLSPTATRTERLCAPGLIFVHAQMLVNMDLTIRRDVSKDEDTRQGPSNITFDDVLGGDPDASAPTLPLPPPTSNATRIMGDNRLIALVREILHSGASYPHQTRQIFAQAFADTLKAAARRTSLYNLSACYVLCDFLEEAFFILVRYERQSPAENTFLDWPFWLDVWRQMVKSNNTTTEIRLYSLLYTLWVPITADPARKAELCSSFLLQPDYFQSRFNHWCPMVRTYYMRLLCWRVARFDGEDQHGDTEMYECLSELLHKTYGHYLYKQQQAMELNLQAPSTTPCNPAPQRRLLIIRTDPVLSRGTNLSFGDPASQRTGNHKRDSLLGDFANLDLRPDSGGSSGTSDSDPDVDEKTPPKKWGLLRTIIGTSKQEHRKSTGNSNHTGGDGRNRMDVPRSVGPSNGASIQQIPNSGGHSQNKHPNQRPFSFKFSLEWTDRLDRRLQNPGPVRILPPRLPAPAQELLQASRPVSEHSSTTPSLSSATLANGSEGKSIEVKGIEPLGEARTSATYSGRSLAEWMLVVSECQSFFDRRKSEGVPGNRWVETPSLGVHDFRRPG